MRVDGVWEGTPVEEAVAGYRDRDDEVAQEAIRATYASLVASEAAPGEQARARAGESLDGYRIKTRSIFG